MDFGPVVSKIIFAIFGLFCVTGVYVLFIYTPVTLYAEAECLRAGYPKAYVSVGLERYCSNLDGAVTVKVDKVSN